ncbi:MAG: 16S rRNA (guanine(527)-N(7))-methyltransferase RsmG [bacterium]|nr:16S rRNA (guanine(527)-N(7))-methyltransferase RsmG [bacterium]
MDALQISLSGEQYEQFLRYYELLLEWNSFMNLTAITDYEEVVLKHFTDSLSLVKAFPDHDFLSGRELSVIDVGTGAGFPALPLKIAFPNWNITMLDSLNKRVQFLNEVIARLGLKKITAIHGRAEDAARKEELRENYDLCVSRAVARLSTLSEYCIPFVKKNGYFVAYKSEKTESELAEAAHALSVLGGQIMREADFYLPGSDIFRKLIVIEKQNTTPKKYPRKAGLPAKEPL